MASRSTVFVNIGASNHAQGEREKNDYYATDPRAAELLCDLETFSPNIWECACGQGHLAEVFKSRGYNVVASDLIDRGYGTAGIDFLKWKAPFDGDIITNPPYKYAKEFVEHALSLIPNGKKVVMFLKVQFLEGQARRKMFDEVPP